MLGSPQFSSAAHWVVLSARGGKGRDEREVRGHRESREEDKLKRGVFVAELGGMSEKEFR